MTPGLSDLASPLFSSDMVTGKRNGPLEFGAPLKNQDIPIYGSGLVLFRSKLQGMIFSFFGNMLEMLHS